MIFGTLNLLPSARGYHITSSYLFNRSGGRLKLRKKARNMFLWPRVWLFPFSRFELVVILSLSESTFFEKPQRNQSRSKYPRLSAYAPPINSEDCEKALGLELGLALFLVDRNTLRIFLCANKKNSFARSSCKYNASCKPLLIVIELMVLVKIIDIYEWSIVIFDILLYIFVE